MFLTWDPVPVRPVMEDCDYGRTEVRTIQFMPAPGGLLPHTSQALLIERHVADLHDNPVSGIAALGITSMTPGRGTPAVIARHIRGGAARGRRRCRARAPGAGAIRSGRWPGPAGRGTSGRRRDGLADAARHRLHEPDTTVARASDEDVVALLRSCCLARDRLIVLLMARAGLRRGEVLSLRRSDVYLLADSSALGCGIIRAHLHAVRRAGNPNRAVAKSRRQRAVPLDFVTVQAFDGYEFGG